MLSKTNLKKIVSYIIPPIITVGLCYVLYSGVDLRGIFGGAKECSLGYVAAFLAFNVLAMIARALRWRLQLRAIGANPGFGDMNRSIFGTYAVNVVFPRLGEFWRCSYISRIASKPFSSVFGTMVADRLSDTVVVGLLSLLTFMLCGSALGRFLESAHLSADFLTSLPAIILYLLAAVFVAYVVWGRGRPAQKIR